MLLPRYLATGVPLPKWGQNPGCFVSNYRKGAGVYGNGFTQRRKGLRQDAKELLCDLCVLALRLCVKLLSMLVEQDGDVAPHVRLVQRRVFERLPDRGSVVRFGE
jgi:hypothetical protein